LRVLNNQRINDEHIAAGLKAVSWPARLQRLSNGNLSKRLPAGGELWLDGGHNADAGVVLEHALNAMPPKPLVVIWGMLNTKDATQFFRPLAKMAQQVFTLSIPDEANAIPGEVLAATVRSLGTKAEAVDDLAEAVRRASLLKPSARVLICGSLYLAGHVLAAEEQTAMSAISGTSRR
jgi:dihydrofolate synthase / folylpolyglutamate synthase